MGIVLVEEARQHIGDERGGEGGVDEAGERWSRSAHRATSEPLAAAQQLAVDGADLLQDLPRALIVGQILSDLFHVTLGDIVHLWMLAAAADRQIVLGTVAATGGTLAARLAAALVALDQRAAEDGPGRRELA
jgi:hypothetical protein